MDVPQRVRAIEMPPFDPLNTRAAQLRAEGHHVISLGQALPFFPPPASALAGARQALEDPAVHLYATDPGLPSLRSALATRLAEFGVACGADDLVITAGGNHAFTLALTTLVGPGDEVVFPSPYFVNHYMAVQALGAVPIEAPVADRKTFATRWEDIEPYLTPRVRAVVLCTPSNPTGAAIDPREGARMVAELARRNIVVFSDETYMQFVYDRPHWSAASADDWRRNVVVVGTFSKCFGMMGWRVGFMLADAAICTEAVKIQDAMIICAPVISQMAAEAAVRESWDYPLTFRDELLKRRHVLESGIRKVPRLLWQPAAGGFFAFVRVEGCEDSAALAHTLVEEAHVVTIPGRTFGAAGEGHLRLSYGAASPADLEEGVARLQRFFR